MTSYISYHERITMVINLPPRADANDRIWLHELLRYAAQHQDDQARIVVTPNDRDHTITIRDEVNSKNKAALVALGSQYQQRLVDNLLRDFEEDRLRLGGNYGVYSVFCVGGAVQMKIISQQPNDEPALVCTMTRGETFTIRQAIDGEMEGNGTKIILSMPGKDVRAVADMAINLDLPFIVALDQSELTRPVMMQVM